MGVYYLFSELRKDEERLLMENNKKCPENLFVLEICHNFAFWNTGWVIHTVALRGAIQAHTVPTTF